MKLTFTRRELAAAAAGITLAGTVEAQTKPASDWLEAARAEHRGNSETLTRFEVPMGTEPAFVFHP